MNRLFLSLQIEHHAHGAKTNDPLMRREDDHRLLLSDPSATLASAGVRDETVLSAFKMEDYVKYRDDPEQEQKW